MKYSVVVSEKAKMQIAEHISFVSNVNKESARKFKIRIIEKLQTLSDMPQRNPYLNNEMLVKNYYRKIPLEDGYLVIYHIEERTVKIDYVLDCRQDYGWLFK